MVGEVHAADCPNHASSGAAQHDQSTGNASRHGDTPATDAGHGSDAGHASDAGHGSATDAGHGSDAGHDHEACTCIGSCHVGAAAGLAASGGALSVLALVYPQRTFAVFAVEPRRERVPYLLPYATSPPA